MERETKNIIAKNIINIRRRNNLSQLEFAETLGVSRSTVAGYENEKLYRLPSIDVLIKISDTYNVSLDDLMKNSIKD